MSYKVFDYIFFRVFKRAILKNGAAPAADGAIFVTLVQVLTIIDIMLVIKLVYPYDIPGLFYWFVPMIVIISSVNWIRYKDFHTFNENAKIWSHETKRLSRRNGLFIVVYFLCSCFFLLGYLAMR